MAKLSRQQSRRMSSFHSVRLKKKELSGESGDHNQGSIQICHLKLGGVDQVRNNATLHAFQKTFLFKILH